jgi:ATP-dependent RNA helicase SUPV3L1/SUV3
MKKTEPAGRDDRRGPGSRDGRDARGPRDAGRGPRDAWGDSRAGRETRGVPVPRLGDAAFRAQRQALEHAEAALRKLAAQAHGEVLTQLLTAWEKRDPAAVPAAQALGARVTPAVRANWVQSLGAASSSVPAEALLRLEMAAEVPTPAEQLDARRQLQLQLLTRRHDAPPSETWGQDVARLLSGSFETESARRLQNVLKVLLRR